MSHFLFAERLTSSKDVMLGLPSFMEVNVKPYRAPTANPPPGPVYGLKPGPGTGSGIAPSFIGHSNSGDEGNGEITSHSCFIFYRVHFISVNYLLFVQQDRVRYVVRSSHFNSTHFIFETAID